MIVDAIYAMTIIIVDYLVDLIRYLL
ncbi:hypothetical protein LKI_03695 [Leuconostoc kimchii IMSNU 11154]|uniref:Uncharacterized protein n=1 Tax=Leuconostoc kimchii (strain IMSNU 11154 / KCTC 2386 / IH25) TaxID=762051 RepID=D5T1Y2_LEUKI|nr:hypothetical protein LKI_03695 [Leuconostoc kimchii IMSNU 11154]